MMLSGNALMTRLRIAFELALLQSVDGEHRVVRALLRDDHRPSTMFNDSAKEGVEDMKHYCPMCGEQWDEDVCGACGWFEGKPLRYSGRPDMTKPQKLRAP